MELIADAAREVGLLDLVLNRWTMRMIPCDKDDRQTDMFREALCVRSKWSSEKLERALTELRIALAKIEKAVNGDWSREIDET
jgi:hypothetical protein